MKILDFLESKTIKLNELDLHFKEIKRVEVDTQRISGKCYNCEDRCNQYQFNSESWTKTFYCAKCKSINTIIFSDRMGGNYTDTIIIYGEK